MPPSAITGTPESFIACATWNSWNAYSLKPYGVADQFAGPFHRMAENCEPRDVRDGLTKTIFFGEVRPTCSIHQTQGWFVSNDGQGLTSTLVPINYDSCSQDSTTHRRTIWLSI